MKYRLIVVLWALFRDWYHPVWEEVRNLIAAESQRYR